MTDKTHCPKCGAEEKTRCSNGFILWDCGYGLGWSREPGMALECKRRTWQRRAEKAEKEVERLEVMFRLHRTKLWLSIPWVNEGALAVFDAETERLIKGSEEG